MDKSNGRSWDGYRMTQHDVDNQARAQQEIAIMSTLRNSPLTPSELCGTLNLPTNRVKYLLQGLYKANCVRKVPGTHIICLEDL